MVGVVQGKQMTKAAWFDPRSGVTGRLSHDLLQRMGCATLAEHLQYLGCCLQYRGHAIGGRGRNVENLVWSGRLTRDHLSS